MQIIDFSQIEGIDEYDEKILKIIANDARLSYTEISEAVGLTRPAVKARMEAMQDKGIIKGYQTIINPTGYDNGIKFILNVTTEPDKYLEVVETLAIFKANRQIYSRTGENTIVVIGFVPDQKAYRNYVEKVYMKIRAMQGVKSIVLHDLINTFKDVDGGIDYDRSRYQQED